MKRWACIDLPAFPLQLLLARHPDWRDLPVAVIDRDHPQGVIEWVNEAAYARGVLPGQRYSAGSALADDLRAGVVDRDEIATAVSKVAETLRHFSPHVEPSIEEPGIFWLDASGLKRLFRSAKRWAGELHAALDEAGWTSSLVLGFTRFGTYAIARSRHGVRLFASAEAERDAARRVRLDRLRFDPKLRDALERLGVRTVDGFLALPAAGLLERFGPEAHRLHRLAADERWEPLQPVLPVEKHHAGTEFEQPDDQAERLLFRTKRLLDPLVAALAERQQAVHAVILRLTLDDGSQQREEVRPAAPTLDTTQLLDLIRLRFETLKLSSGVVELDLELDAVDVEEQQLALWQASAGRSDRPHRDLAAARRALARLRAELGPQAVVRARLREGHLPEATFLWEPLDTLDAPGTVTSGPTNAEDKPLVRRLFSRPRALPPRPHHLRDDGWLIRGGGRDAGYGAVRRFLGPYVISGGWWAKALRRDYHFAETVRGDLLWVYFDPLRRRWYQQGEVE